MAVKACSGPSPGDSGGITAPAPAAGGTSNPTAPAEVSGPGPPDPPGLSTTSPQARVRGCSSSSPAPSTRAWRTASGLPPVCSTISATTVADISCPRPATSARQSGTGSPDSRIVGRPRGSAGDPGPSRRATSIATGPSTNRRATKASIWRDSGSSHWKSSTTTSSGPGSATAASMPSAPAQTASGAGTGPGRSARATASASRCTGGRASGGNVSRCPHRGSRRSATPAYAGAASLAAPGPTAPARRRSRPAPTMRSGRSRARRSAPRCATPGSRASRRAAAVPPLARRTGPGAGPRPSSRCSLHTPHPEEGREGRA